MPAAQIVDCVRFMPERVVSNAGLIAESDREAAVQDDPFFRGVRERRFASPDYTSAQLGALATRELFARTGTRPESVDVVITSCVLTDLLANGIGAAVQHMVGASRATMINVDTNCTSYLSSLNVARAFIESGMAKTVVVVTVTNFISRMPEYQRSRSSWVLGDGASATLMTAGTRSILSSHERSLGQNYGLLLLESEQVGGVQKAYWEGGGGPLTVNFAPDLLDNIRENATELLPDAVKRCIADAGLTPDDIAMLITHQPNELFLAAWRERIGIGPPRAFDTLDHYGNLFMGSIPVTLAEAIELGKIRRGDVLAFGTFANGGDFVSAMVVRW